MDLIQSSRIDQAHAHTGGNQMGTLVALTQGGLPLYERQGVTEG